MAQSPPAAAPADRSVTAGAVYGLVQGDYNTVYLTYNNYGAAAAPAPGPSAEPVLTTTQLLPAPFLDILDRAETSAQLLTAIRERTAAELSGQQGIGKSTLLRTVCRQVDLAQFTSGVAYLEQKGQPVEDLLQFLFATFYNAPQGYKPVGALLLRYLQAITALVVIDDLTLTREQADYLRNCVPNCTFVIADQRTQMTEGTTVRLTGLPEAEARTLLERRLKRPLTAAEQTSAHDLWAAVAGNPLYLIQAAGLIDGGSETMATLAQKLSAGGPAQLGTAAVAAATPEEKQLLATLSSLGDSPVAERHVAAIAGGPDATAMLRSLSDRGLVQSHSPSFTAVDNVTTSLPPDGIGSTLDRVVSWAAAAPSRDDLIEGASLVEHAILVAAKAERWNDVIKLSRGIETGLAENGRWGAWKWVLDQALWAARQAGSRNDEGWALHQLGTRSLGLEELETSRTLLTEAATVRQRAGDETGAQISKQNLRVLDVLRQKPTLVPRKLPRPGGSAVRTVALVGAAAVAVTGLLAIGLAVITPPPLPALTVGHLDPGSIGAGAVDFKVAIAGTGFDSSVVVDAGNDVTINVTSSGSPTLLGAVVNVSPKATLGKRDVAFVESGGRSATCRGCLSIAPAPLLETLQPSYVGPGSKDQPVHLVGTNISVGAQLTFSGNGVTAKPVVADPKDGRPEALVTVDPNAASTQRLVTITNPDGGTSTCLSPRCFSVNFG